MKSLTSQPFPLESADIQAATIGRVLKRAPTEKQLAGTSATMMLTFELKIPPKYMLCISPEAQRLATHRIDMRSFPHQWFSCKNVEVVTARILPEFAARISVEKFMAKTGTGTLLLDPNLGGLMGTILDPDLMLIFSVYKGNTIYYAVTTPDALFDIWCNVMCAEEKGWSDMRWYIVPREPVATLPLADPYTIPDDVVKQLQLEPVETDGGLPFHKRVDKAVVRTDLPSLVFVVLTPEALKVAKKQSESLVERGHELTWQVRRAVPLQEYLSLASFGETLTTLLGEEGMAVLLAE